MELTALTDDITDVYSLELNDDFNKSGIYFKFLYRKCL